MWQVIKNIYHLVQSFLSAAFFDFPSKKLTTIGVTGTDGKTTTATLIYHILSSAGYKVAIVSSINALIGKEVIETGFHITTPSPYQVQKLLKKAVDEGSQFAVLEVTSHALDQNRVFAINFDLAVFTNITNEHLDYHKTFNNYLIAKAKLFKKSKISILNTDDASFAKLKTLTNSKIISYGLTKTSNVNPFNFPFQSNLEGEFNKYNVLAAIAACRQLKISDSDIRLALKSFPQVKGRMEKVDLGKPFEVIVDFAHTPNALKNALKTLKTKSHGRLIAVFGCAGERDFKKRPEMGKIASSIADLVVLTAEDPRREDVNQIINQIANGSFEAGAKEDKNLFRIGNRYQAIKFAITKLAKPNDIVAVFGKGHEKSMSYNNKEYPWSDFKAVKVAVGKNETIK